MQDRGERELRGERRGIGERSLKVDGRSVFCTFLYAPCCIPRMESYEVRSRSFRSRAVRRRAAVFVIFNTFR